LDDPEAVIGHVIDCYPRAKEKLHVLNILGNLSSDQASFAQAILDHPSFSALLTAIDQPRFNVIKE
jgi:hypothetical protein